MTLPRAFSVRSRIRRLTRPLAVGLPLGLLATLLPGAAWAEDAPEPEPYSLTWVATRPLWYEGDFAEAIGDKGHVVGESIAWETRGTAWVWSGGSRTQRGEVAQQNAVNSSGDAVGMRHNDTTDIWTNQAYRLSGGSGEFLGTLADNPAGTSVALDINDAGVSVGEAENAAWDSQPVIWSANGHVDLLPTLPEQDSGRAVAINNAGTAVGYVQGGDGYGAVRWQDDRAERIEDLVNVTDINDAGVIIGERTFEAGGGWVRWDQGEVEPLDGEWVVARAMNENGDVVGSSGNDAVLWRGGSSTPVRLDTLVNDPALDIQVAMGITDDGAILVAGEKAGVTQFFVMRPAVQQPFLGALAVEQPEVPTGAWTPVPDEGTIDGNDIRLRATVRNPDASAKEVRLIITRGTEVLTKTPLTATVPARGAQDVTFEWDSTGAAWDGDEPAPAQEFRVRLFVDGEEVGAKEATVAVRPRPMVLVHGFNADASTWSAYPGIVHGVRPDWPVYAVGDGQAPGQMDTGSLTQPTHIPNTIVDNAEVMAGYVDGVRDQLDAQDVDVVAHSMGGLISRQYVESFMPRDRDGDNVVSRLIMLGTPNHGSPCASLLPLAGMYELRPEVVEAYNTRMQNRPGVPMSVLAGTPLPFTCDEPGPGDGVVALPSAVTGYTDTATVGRVHTSITKGEDFAGFVLPRLVREAPAVANFDARSSAGGAALATSSSAPQLLRTATSQVAPDHASELGLDVADADAMGVTFVAPATVAAQLFDQAGAVVASSPAGDAQPVRTLRLDDPADGRYVLRLTNQGAATVSVPLSAWVSGGPLRLEASASGEATGRAALVAKLTRDGAAVPNATVTAQLESTDGDEHGSVVLTDAGDGTFTGRSARLAPGSYFVTVTAAYGGAARSTLLSVEVPKATEVEDTKAPVTTAVRPAPTGDAGWDRGPVRIAMSAADGEDGSGVATLHYALGSGAPQVIDGDRGEVLVDRAGQTEVRFWAVDRAGNVEKEQRLVVRIDAVPPTATCRPSTQRLWPPNHRMVPVKVTCGVADRQSGVKSVTLVAAVSSDPDDAPGAGDGATRGDIAGFAVGTRDFTGWLRAEKSNVKPQRTYRLAYRVRDVAGNATIAVAEVRVAAR